MRWKIQQTSYLKVGLVGIFGLFPRKLKALTRLQLVDSIALLYEKDLLCVFVNKKCCNIFTFWLDFRQQLCENASTMASYIATSCVYISFFGTVAPTASEITCSSRFLQGPGHPSSPLYIYFLCVFLQCFDTVGWVIWPVKTRPRYDL